MHSVVVSLSDFKHFQIDLRGSCHFMHPARVDRDESFRRSPISNMCTMTELYEDALLPQTPVGVEGFAL